MQDRLEAAEQALRAALERQKAASAGEPDCRALVVAVLRALREPSPEMLDAGVRVHELEGDRIDITPELRAIWQAMVDAAAPDPAPPST